jgi:tricorn protease
MRVLAAAVLLFGIHLGHAAEQTEIRGIVWSAVSPDGETVAFEWLNDIWLASTLGGDAERLAMHPARDAYPKFSPDGERLFFASERTGSLQVYSVKLDGSDLKQHSDHTEGNILEAIAPDGTYAVARGLRYASGHKPFRLVKVDIKGKSREIALFDATAHSVSISPDGSKFLFCRGGEQPYRSGYIGSRASEIHLYDEMKKSFQVVIDENWEARFPMWRADGESFYYISNKSGSFNIWLKSFGMPSDKQLTFFEKESIILPSISADGKVMIFRAGYKTYRFEPESSKPPEEIGFFTRGEMPDVSRKENVRGTNSVAFDESENRIVFSAAGDLWTMGMEDKNVLRLTDSDASDEREVQLSLDGSSLYYLSDDGLKTDVVSASLVNHTISQKKVISSNKKSKRSLRISPDGSRLAWLEVTGNLVTAKLDGSKARVVMRNWDMPTYDWSPDGNWLVVAAKDVHSNRDIWLVPADASREAFNLTRHPAFEGSPKWSPDGKQIVFTARREIDGLSRLWMIQAGDLLSKTALGEMDLKAIAASVKRIESDIVDPKRVVWAEDSKALLFQNQDVADEHIYSLSVSGGEKREVSAFRGIPAGKSRDGKSYWRRDRIPVVFDGEKLKSYEFSFTVKQERRSRLRLGFRKIWRTLAERFYDKSMNETDWGAMLETYEDAAAESRDAKQFDRVVAQLLGELNASHLTFQYTPWGLKSATDEAEPPHAHPGLEFEATWQGALVIRKVILGSPISKVEGAPMAGEVVRRIAGRDVDASTPLAQFFKGAKGTTIPLTVEDKNGKPRTLELVPVSYGRIRFLDRKQMEAAARTAAEDQGFVYLPFLKMKVENLEALSLEVFRASTHASGLVLDLRDNAGGRVADELLAMFCQPNHTFTIPRDGPRGYPTDRRVSPSWDGPMVVLCNGNTFSNAEIFCHAYKQQRRGELIGTQTNGGVISAVGVKIPEVGELQIPFRGWFDAQTGRDLELNGAVPNLVIPFLPEDEIIRSDPQLKAAIDHLLEKIKTHKEPINPKYKSYR